MQKIEDFGPDGLANVPNELLDENVQEADYVASMLLSDPQSLNETEIKLIYENRLKNKPVSEMTDWETAVAARYGDWVKNQRESAEIKGVEAEIEAVRRKARAQAARQGTAAFLRMIFDENVRKVANGAEFTPLKIEISCDGHKIAVDEQIIHTAFTSIHHQQGRAYTNTVGNLLDLIGRAAQQQMLRDARPNGKDYSAHLYDINWVDYRNSLQSTPQ